MKKILSVLVSIIEYIGILKINLACDWVWFQEKETSSLRKYKNH